MRSGWTTLPRRNTALFATILMLAFSIGVARAQPAEQTPEEYNRQAAQEQAEYMRQWNAEQAALHAQALSGDDLAVRPHRNEHSGEMGNTETVAAAGATEPTQATDSSDRRSTSAAVEETTPNTSTGDAEPAPTNQETIELACVNARRTQNQLPSATLRDLRYLNSDPNFDPCNSPAQALTQDPTDLAQVNAMRAQDGRPPLRAEQLAASNQQVADAEAHRQTADQIGKIVLIGALALVALGIFLLPTIVAFRRGHHYRWIIFILNVTIAWSGVGWVWPFVWAVWPRNRALAEPIYGDATGIDHRA